MAAAPSQPKKEGPVSGRWKGFLLYSIFAVISLLIVVSLFNPLPDENKVPISQVIGDVKGCSLTQSGGYCGGSN